MSGGVRYDWVRFDVTDHHLTDGVDNSGARTNSALSGSVGLSWSRERAFMPYANVSTSFETPTTTELVNQPNGAGGFNDQLKPQRAVNYEIGARGRPDRRVTYSVALFLGRIKDAIVQQQEVGGRAFFVNAGKTHNDGAEVGPQRHPRQRAHPERSLHLCTISVRGLQDRLRAPKSIRSTATACPAFPSISGDWDSGPFLPRRPLPRRRPHDQHLDRGRRRQHHLRGRMGSRASPMHGSGGRVTSGAINLAPFFGVNNLWDRQYVGSVTLNGAGGRVIEPAPRRVIYAGMEIGYRTGS